ncbi:hypothetical protein ACFR9U_12535 [Halorientalis brevis]|uniref:DUF4129 domain-containing protein n=1 Tax=Halorientalis brevis TaxID=1126241 RepID=A0ABD6CCR0_9EURY|nr:hypothetical protein [Halorientalis brevis]
MSGRTRLVAVTAGVLLAVASLVVLAPGLLPVSRPHLVSLMDDVANTVGIAGLALVAGAIAVVQGLWSSKTPSAPPAMPVDSTDDGEPAGLVPGAEFDEHLAAAGRIGGRTTEEEAVVREDLRRLATDVYKQVHRCDWETAARAIEEGRWTDDPSAAAFVGGPDAPDVPLRLWFRDVISEDGAFYRQVTRTIRALYALRTEASADVSVTGRDGDLFGGDATSGESEGSGSETTEVTER